MFPSLNELELVRKKIKHIPNRQGEYKRKIHYCCFLLGYKSGLRISEAIKFDLTKKDKNGLYRISKTKGKKERMVYVPKKVISELKANNWQPNQTNRWTFYWFLQKIKRELNIDKKVELTPHTLRRAFTTYHAEIGMPLPLLQKWLGHDSVRTTILYWRNPYEKPFAGKIPVNEKDFDDILAGKKWLEDKNEPPKLPITENFPTIGDKEFDRPDNLPLTNTIEKSTTITNNQLNQLTREVSPPTPAKFSLNLIRQKSDQLEIANNEEKSSEKQNFVGDQKEQILLEKIKNLEEQLAKVQTENNNLKTKLTVAEKEKNQARERFNHYQQQLKIIVKTFNQWQKISYCQQLEKEQKNQAQIIQLLPKN
ncbi:MAG: tyrosine recombinase XerD [Mycoplasmataceae bacterium RV_VA103A]|nr:MAG: tyrosine recombinase XerD [Mycoplasmataceae bacterium RV_VA103A]